MRRIILVTLVVLTTILALGTAVVAGSGGSTSTVTRGRLERSLPVVFSNLYTQQAALLGRPKITPESLNAHAMCDKHGADVADVGPGGDWICLMSWTDPKDPMPAEGYGKFELNVHSNDCYSAIGQTKLTGFLTLTDTRGRVVTNPVFEFDGCFDPNGDTSPTGVYFPSLLNVTSTSVSPDADLKGGVQVTCATGVHGCSGSITVMAGKASLGTIPLNLKEETTATLPIPQPVPIGADEVTFEFTLTNGFGPTSPVTLPVQGA